MWLRNLCVFLGTDTFPWSAADIENALGEALCPECGDQTVSVGGFVPPIKGEHAMTHVVDGLAVCVYQEISRVLPGPVLSEEVEERIERIQTNEGRTVGRREKADIRDQAHFELLPRAFTRSKRTACVIDLRASRVWVDASSDTRAETVVTALREALGTLPVTRPEPRMNPAEELSRWVADEHALPNGFECGDRCLLESDRRGEIQRARERHGSAGRRDPRASGRRHAGRPSSTWRWTMPSSSIWTTSSISSASARSI